MDIFTINSPKNTFRKKIAPLLHRGLGDEDPLPDWVTEILDECDAGINMDLREELLMEGAIVLTR
jgi:hypothetical protein